MRWMERDGVQPNYFTYALLIEVRVGAYLLRGGRIRGTLTHYPQVYGGHRSEGWLKPDLVSVESVLEYMHGNGMVGNLPVWTAVLSAYAYAGDSEVCHATADGGLSLGGGG